MLDMMHKLRSVWPAADLTVPVVVPKDCCGQFPPFPADIERMHISGSNQAEEPIKKTLSHRQQKNACTKHRIVAIHGTGTKAQALGRDINHRLRRAAAAKNDQVHGTGIGQELQHIPLAAGRTFKPSRVCLNFTTLSRFLQSFFRPFLEFPLLLYNTTSLIFIFSCAFRSVDI